MVNDRVNCMRYVLPPSEVHTLYNLTTFFVYDLGFHLDYILLVG